LRTPDSVTKTRNLSTNYNKCIPEGHLDSLADIKENIDTYPITAKMLLQSHGFLKCLVLPYNV